MAGKFKVFNNFKGLINPILVWNPRGESPGNSNIKTTGGGARRTF